MNVKPIHKLSASDQVVDQIKENLITGHWKPGEKLPSENELASAFGVSRITVRQALSRLSAVGLLETRLGEGTFVCKISPGFYMQDMMPVMYLNALSSADAAYEMLEFRLMYEAEAAAIAALKITDNDLARMRKTLDNLNNIAREGSIELREAYVEGDLSFHMQIAKATNNSLVVQLSALTSNLIRSGIRNLYYEDTINEGIKMHEKIYKALLTHDEEQARYYMSSHLRYSLDRHAKLSAGKTEKQNVKSS